MVKEPSPSEFFLSASRVKRGTTSRLIRVRLPEDLVQRLAEVGNEQGLAMSDTIRLVLERGLTSKQRKGTS
jgi:hypothetical protein